MGERLSSVFSADGTLISASAAPHCGRERAKRKHLNLPFKNQVNFYSELSLISRRGSTGAALCEVGCGWGCGQERARQEKNLGVRMSERSH